MAHLCELCDWAIYSTVLLMRQPAAQFQEPRIENVGRRVQEKTSAMTNAQMLHAKNDRFSMQKTHGEGIGNETRRKHFKVIKNVNFETNFISNETWRFHLLTKMITLK